MAKNLLVINCDIRETRVCLIEDGVIAELHMERAAAHGTVGNVVLGRVTRVLPGMQAAFIDVGQERAAFLHVEDLIRPDDFDRYLSKGSADDLEGGRRSAGLATEEEDEERPAPVAAAADEEDDDGLVFDAPVPDVPSEISLEPVSERDSDEDAEDDDDVDSDEDAEDAEDDDVEDVGEGDEAKSSPPVVGPPRRRMVPPASSVSPPAAESAGGEGAAAAPQAAGEVLPQEEDEAETEASTEEGPSTDSTPADSTVAPQDEAGGEEGPAGAGRRGRRRRRRGGRGRGAAQEEKAPVAVAEPVAAASVKDGDGSSRRRRRKRGKDRRAEVSRPSQGSQKGKAQGGLRVSRSVPITEVVKEGDEVIVQVSKEPIGTKGARVTSHVSLPGRYVVYLPTVEHVGISKRIGSARERSRLRQVMDGLKPPRGGLIVRTVAEGLTKKSLKQDIAYLVKLWEDVAKRRQNAKAPALLYSELDLVLKTARDLFTSEISKIVIDDKDQYARLVRFVEMFLPERVKDIELYSGGEPIFDAYGIEDEIARALSRKVPLPSGGYLVIDQAEALTAIDVNTGRFVGKGSKDLEETAFKTNLEAVAEIAYQLRFRNIGGLVILDLIDMDHASNRDKVLRALEQALAKDKAKTTLNRISELGLIEMTRKRTRESLMRTMHEPCFYCDGTGQVMSRSTIAYEILRQIRRELGALKGYSVLVNAHPAIVDLLQTEEREAVVEAERRYMRRIEFHSRPEYHIEQYDLHGR